MLHIGFTGTRHGMSEEQRVAVMRVLEDQLDGAMMAARLGFVAHHGDCVGADAQFHEIVLWGFRPLGSWIDVHPGPAGDRHRAYSSGYDRIHDPQHHMARNRAIVAVSNIMIAAPFEPTPQKRGGTWATIRMALRALRAGKLRDLYVVGRDGKLMDHSGWRVS